jgi:dTDP-4-amino-4,6-dideoxygalactose transaminase
MSGLEAARLAEVFESNYIAPVGPMLERFERKLEEITSFDHVVALASGTAAVHLAVLLAGAGPGDEVWSSTLTFIGGVAGIVYQGAKPVFFDVDPRTWNIDLDLLAQELDRARRQSRLPKAVIATDLYGYPCDLAAIRSLCEPLGVRLISDAAESLGAEFDGRPAGAGADFACYSFNGNKIVTTSGGGALATQDDTLAQRARYLATQAREPVLHYQHVTVGYNYRLSNVLAAIGVAQLDVLTERVTRRREIFDGYRRRLAGVAGLSFLPEQAPARSNRWLTTMLVDPAAFGADCHRVIEALAAAEIEARPLWKPMHLQPVFKDATIFGGRIAERLFATGVCLPSGTQLTESDLDRICEVIVKARG